MKPASLIVRAAILDTGLVVVFVLIGRVSHRENLLGTLNTLWPFLLGLAVGWTISRAWRHPSRILWTGVIVWVSTVIVGMLLRLLTHQGVVMSFVIVATIVLCLFLLSWRGIDAMRRRRVRAD